MFERFTDQSRRVMAVANVQSGQYRQGFLRPEFLLLALLMEESGPHLNVLAALNIDPGKLKISLESQLQTGKAKLLDGRFPQTPEAKLVIENSIAASRSMAHGCVGTEHLLLGLINAGSEPNASLFASVGLDYEKATAAVKKLGPAASRVSEFDPPSPETRLSPDGLAQRVSMSKQVRRLLELAYDEASKLKQPTVEPEHVLLALLTEQNGLASELLTSLGLKADNVRSAVAGRATQ